MATRMGFEQARAKPNGLAIPAQGDDLDSAKPVTFASRATNVAEKNYPQIDLEAVSVDFGLFRFRNYLVGSPQTITVVTDHKPLVSIFNGRRHGSIRTDKIKHKNKDIIFRIHYQKGSINQADYLSCDAKSLDKASEEEKTQSNDINNLLYMLHTTPITT